MKIVSQSIVISLSLSWASMTKIIDDTLLKAVSQRLFMDWYFWSRAGSVNTEQNCHLSPWYIAWPWPATSSEGGKLWHGVSATFTCQQREGNNQQQSLTWRSIKSGSCLCWGETESAITWRCLIEDISDLFPLPVIQTLATSILRF